MSMIKRIIRRKHQEASEHPVQAHPNFWMYE